MKREIVWTFEHHYRLSKSGYIHFPILAISIGSNGCAIWAIGLSLTIAIIKKQGHEVHQ